MPVLRFLYCWSTTSQGGPLSQDITHIKLYWFLKQQNEKGFHPQTWELSFLLGPFSDPFLWFGWAGGTFQRKVHTACSGETNMHFQPSILTSNQPTTIIICLHFIIVMTFFQHSSKLSWQLLRDSFLFRAGESVGSLLPGEMFFF